jgi:hypothetical protein
VNKLIGVVFSITIIVAQVSACTNGGRKGIIYHCCGGEIAIQVCTTGGSGQCQEYETQYNCGCTLVGGAGSCLSASAASRQHEIFDVPSADLWIASARRTTSCSNGVSLEQWVRSNYLDRQQ